MQPSIITTKSTIAVIGGTGKAGKYLVRQLIQQGFPIRALARDPDTFQPDSPLVTIVKGDVGNYTDVLALLDGCHAVISTLGQPKGRSPIFSEASTHIIRAMEERNIRRYILVTGLSIDLPSDKKSTPTAQASAYMRQLFPEIIADKQKEYTILSGSPIDWTLVRTPLIEQTDEQGRVEVSLEDCPGSKISATDLANFLIGQLTETKYSKAGPFVATASA